MTYLEFVRQVYAMRQSQRLYFRTRAPADLKAARTAERLVDLAVRSYFDPQRSLFDLSPAEPTAADGAQEPIS